VFFWGLIVHPGVCKANTVEDYGIISVYGEAVITAAPDIARVVMAVETRHESSKTAAEENARLTDAVIDALVKAGFDKKQVKTSGYRLISYEQPVDPQNREGKYTTVYRAYNELTVTVYDLNRVGNVVDIAIKAGANRIVSIHFELKDEEALKLQALQNATTQAKAKAVAIAQSAGVTIKGIKVIHEEMSGYSPYRVSLDESAKMMEQAPTPIIPGDVEVTARVNVEYFF
jgi:uncharacterized protein YggE